MSTTSKPGSPSPVNAHATGRPDRPTKTIQHQGTAGGRRLAPKISDEGVGAGTVPDVTLLTRYETIDAGGDGQFDAYCAVPESGHGPGILLFQEVFGVNDNMRGLADRLADAGYLTLVPDMFWRIEPRFERQDESGITDAFAVAGQLDPAATVVDMHSAHGHLLAMTECTGRVGVLGFCLGGGLAFAAATTSRVGGRGPDAAVCYYGSAINDMLGQVDQLECPTLFHYGDNDTYIPADKIAEVAAAVAGRPEVELYHYDAGHAFSNWDRRLALRRLAPCRLAPPPLGPPRVAAPISPCVILNFSEHRGHLCRRDAPGMVDAQLVVEVPEEARFVGSGDHGPRH